MADGQKSPKRHIELKSRVREAVFGMQDGLISTIGLVAGLQGAIQNTRIVLIGGLIEVISGAVSMATGSYLSTQAMKEVYDREIQTERERIEEAPYLAREALLDSLREEGLSRERAYHVVRLLQESKRAFLKTFQEKILGIGSAETEKPLEAALVMGVSFCLGGAIPLLPYLIFGGMLPLYLATGLTALSLFGVGAMKARLAAKNVWVSGLEFFLIAMGAAAFGYAVGNLLPEVEIMREKTLP